MRVLLVSTYELGHQPLHVASPAAALLAAGHEVRALDLAVEPWDHERLGWAEAVGFSVPMHTAMRLAVAAARRLRRERPGLPLVAYGLYAGVGSDRTVEHVFDRSIVGEYQAALLEWVARLAGEGSPPQGMTVELGHTAFPLPARHLLPGLESYAHLEVDGELRKVGYVEASHGCRHRCRHCPLPAVYDGRFRVVDVDTVVADVAQLVSLGARHITLGDPDFLNGPAHALRTIRAIHQAFPHLTYDVTVKVEHVLAHPEVWPELRRLGVLFVVSAFETTNPRVLRLLDKGHSPADMSQAVQLLRQAGIEVRPSWLPFTPWTALGDPAEILDFAAAHQLVGNLDPVQLSIRLLVPDGSLVLDLAAFQPYATGYDPDALSHGWQAETPEVDGLQQRLAAVAAAGADSGAPPQEVLDRMAQEVAKATPGWDAAAWRAASAAGAGGPRLTESWFCCAEPTERQVGVVAPAAPQSRRRVG